MSALNAAAASLISSPSVKEYLGDEITVTHGGHTSDEFWATVVEECREAVTSEGAVLQWKGISLQFDAADLVIDGDQVEPTPGMVVSWDSRTYEILALNESEPCFRYMGDRTRLVAFAKQIPTP